MSGERIPGDGSHRSRQMLGGKPKSEEANPHLLLLGCRVCPIYLNVSNLTNVHATSYPLVHSTLAADSAAAIAEELEVLESIYPDELESE